MDSFQRGWFSRFTNTNLPSSSVICPNPQKIKQLNLCKQAYGRISFAFQNFAGQNFSLVMVTQDSRTLSGRECDAFVNAFFVAFMDTDITNTLFDHLLKSLSTQFPRVLPPQLLHNARRAFIFPGWKNPSHCTDDHHIVKTNFFLACKNTVMVRAVTASDFIHILSLASSYAAYGLSATDCRFLIYALSLLRTGNVVSPDTFLSETHFFRDICPSFKFKIRSEYNIAHVYTFKSAPDEPRSPLPQRIQEATERIFSQKCPWLLPSQEPQKPGMPQRSPYPYISFIRRIKKDEAGEVFLAIRRWSPCSVRVFFPHVKTSHFFNQTVKQLLIMPPHPNVIGVLDFFLEPQRAIVMDDMTGEVLLSFIADRCPLVKTLFLQLALEISSGLAFLHKHGFVHHKMGTFNVVIRDNHPYIAGIECGFIHFSRFPNPENSDSAPLHHNDSEIYADRVDVATFAAMLWEMISGEQILVNDNVKMTELRLKHLVFDRKDQLLSQISAMDDAVLNLIKKCWLADQAQRPSMSEVEEILGQEVNRTFSNTELGASSQHNSASSRNQVEIEIEKRKQAIHSPEVGNHGESEVIYGQEAIMEPYTDRPRIVFKDRQGNNVDAFANYESRYLKIGGSRRISEKVRAFLNWRDCQSFMNTMEQMSWTASKALGECFHLKPGINQIRHKEAHAVFGNEIMSQLECGFTDVVDCTDGNAIYDALTMPFRNVCPPVQEVEEKSHIRLALSYRHVHPDIRNKKNWPHRQRISVEGYRTIAARVSRYACSVGAETVAIWTDQHYSQNKGSETWGNNCLLPYAAYPVVYFESGNCNHKRLWICAEHQLALSGEGIIAEANELEGIWRKTKSGAVAGKLLPLPRGLVEATTCLLSIVDMTETYHAKDREDIIAWTRAIAFFGYSSDIWNTYSSLDSSEITSEIAGAIVKQGWSPTWIWNYAKPRWKDGAVVRTSNGIRRKRNKDERIWHNLWSWVQLNEEYMDTSEAYATIEVEDYTRVTVIETETQTLTYAFVFLVGKAGQIGRCSVVELESNEDGFCARSFTVLSDFDFTIHAESLQRIACMKEEPDQAYDKFGRYVEHRYPSERIGSPSVQAVNSILKMMELPTVKEIVKFRFLDGHEVGWK